jgi:hypothetical protein
MSEVSRSSKTQHRVGQLLLTLTILFFAVTALIAVSLDSAPAGSAESSAVPAFSNLSGTAKTESPATSAPGILTFAVVAALVTTVGTLVGHVLKEVLLARSFELWKARRASDAVYRKYRDPIVLAALELAHRLREICFEYPTDFLGSKLLDGPALDAGQASGRDQYFCRYKCQSTAYRLAALLGWLELYRQEIVFLDTGKSTANRRLYDILQQIRSDLADGHLNEASDWNEWSDSLIFREEQRAIGETLIKQEGGTRLIASYGTFISLLEAKDDAGAKRWLQVLTNFFLDPAPSKDFRRIRYNRLFVHLVDLVRALDAKTLPSRLTDAYEGCREELSASSA